MNVTEIDNILSIIGDIKRQIKKQTTESTNDFKLGLETLGGSEDIDLSKLFLTYNVYLAFHVSASTIKTGAIQKGSPFYYIYLYDDKTIYLVNNEKIVSKKDFILYINPIIIKENKNISYYTINDKFVLDRGEFKEYIEEKPTGWVDMFIGDPIEEPKQVKPDKTKKKNNTLSSDDDIKLLF